MPSEPVPTAPPPPMVWVRVIETFSVHCGACGLVKYPLAGSNHAGRRAAADQAVEDHKKWHQENYLVLWREGTDDIAR